MPLSLKYMYLILPENRKLSSHLEELPSDLIVLIMPFLSIIFQSKEHRAMPSSTFE